MKNGTKMRFFNKKTHQNEKNYFKRYLLNYLRRSGENKKNLWYNTIN